MQRSSVLLVVWALFCVCRPALVAGHGYLTIPAAKQLVNNPQGVTWQNGNSIGFGGGRPISNPGICGDPFQGSSSSVATIPFNSGTTTVYSQGSTISLTITLTANHGGRHSFRVCPSTTPTESCFGNNWLTTDGNPSSTYNVNGRAFSYPVNQKRYWYIDYPGDALFATTPEVHRSTWRLPAGVSCPNGCIIQWYYAAYQNCALPCEDPSWDDTAKCGLSQKGQRVICDGSSSFFVERFYNCADVKIGGGGGTPATSPPTGGGGGGTTTPPSGGGGGGGGGCPRSFNDVCRSTGPGVWADPCSCSNFYNCGIPDANGNYGGGVTACPAGLVFDTAGKYCGWPGQATCTVTGK